MSTYDDRQTFRVEKTYFFISEGHATWTFRKNVYKLIIKNFFYEQLISKP